MSSCQGRSSSHAQYTYETDSVAAVAAVRANADLSDEVHEIVLSPGCRRPCTEELVRKVGEEAVSLLRRHRRVRVVCAGLVACEKEEQTIVRTSTC